MRATLATALLLGLAARLAAAGSPFASAEAAGGRRLRSSSSSSRSAFLSADAAGSSLSSAAASSKREVPGWGQPMWGGRSFEDSVANVNPWAKVREVPVVSDMDPVAPLDRLDKDTTSVTDAAPLEPGLVSAESHPPPPRSLQSDWVAPYSFPRTFPADLESSEVLGKSSSPVLPLTERNLIASKDKLGNYPLVAPADRILTSRDRAAGWVGVSDFDPWPVASTERVPERFSKYFQQVHDRELERTAKMRTDKGFKDADLDSDGSLSREEYMARVSGYQNKTEKEAEALWNKVHDGESDSMNKAEFSRLFNSGFDLGAIPRNDISSMMPLTGGPEIGFWGSGAACPLGGYVRGARLKVMSPAGGAADDTALNGVAFKCTTGQEVKTVEGPDGQWTAWAECPEGQQVYSVRAKINAFMPGCDNTGLESLDLGCRMPDLSSMAKLRFGDGNAAVALGPGALAKGGSSHGGGWSNEMMCDSHSAVCGAQAHVVRDQGDKGDNLGVANLRVYCCSAPVDCRAACGPQNDGPGSVGCQVCRQAAGVAKPEGPTR
mmetsp:Transcript_11051/g.39007  ORF Transcript_11051/g.39007 Transcript_11051/m.39007 type:complete len:549 (-) Transcript_11051:63-1709(-)|eukprot:CAMPEP_0203877862 /NCGR_PEP_ID=MMETSP0359-20131031/22434_1 /ASSEMBLY_ACC=CAM_ASM_000338 /TAXON_ID=268821 /ORGANISM="Scrippsiella Hangoei, Strain SHTV-5" /LENGTH=548 /DNA_ID=CAMNT_0050796919 /DNA_START=84 /DNA_END=1730 /DNA_ORIENTATION=-